MRWQKGKMCYEVDKINESLTTYRVHTGGSSLGFCAWAIPPFHLHPMFRMDTSYGNILSQWCTRFFARTDHL